MKVIIIDDDLIYLEMMKSIFELGGYKVDVFQDKYMGYSSMFQNVYEITVIGKAIIENK